jgi:hypothetical protein
MPACNPAVKTIHHEEYKPRVSEHDKEAVLMKVHFLVEFGPELSRPHADTLHGSKMSKQKNIKIMSGGNKMTKKTRNAIEVMESMMSPESVQRARMKAEQAILAINLGRLREKRGLKQNEIDNFSQTSVSRLEKYY